MMNEEQFERLMAEVVKLRKLTEIVCHIVAQKDPVIANEILDRFINQAKEAAEK